MLLFDTPGECLLLIRCAAKRDDADPFVFWITPGGEVEPGETDVEAAARELHEELGLRVELAQPVHLEQGGEYVHLGEHVRNVDTFFAARCERDAPVLTGVTADEIGLMREVRWWTLRELEQTTEKVFPVQIPALAGSLLQGSRQPIPTATR